MRIQFNDFNEASFWTNDIKLWTRTNYLFDTFIFQNNLHVNALNSVEDINHRDWLFRNFLSFCLLFFFWQILETNLKFFYTNLSLKCFKLRLINVAKFYAYTSILTLENNVLFTIAKSCGEYFKKCIKCINITISNLAHVCNVNHQPWQLLRLAKNNRNASWLWTDLLFK